MFKLSATLAILFPDTDPRDAVEPLAETGVDAVEYFDWQHDAAEEVVTAYRDAGLDVAATLAATGFPLAEPALTDPDQREAAVDALERSVDGAAALDVPVSVVTVGAEQEGLDRETQREKVVDCLAAAAPRAEERDVTLVVEPLNTAVDTPGYFLARSEEGFDIVDAVDSPNVKLLYDVYHQQVTEGNVIATLTENVDRIGHVHVADVPGRHKPGTGELHYENILGALAETGYDGYVGCEFAPTGDPAAAVASVVDLVDGL
ncbi:hydroxypyruvate isomerase family protein [Haloprofundus halobius]|uniref:hydroxypyruvate isomerase family protein n=1 Tax=Haloprofundus halobius TaxID=2876194 RepID=UPI001CC9965F|nr:TIM barrel protein [Haloprofundus halobius]